MITKFLKILYRTIINILKILLFLFILIFLGEDIIGLILYKNYNIQAVFYILYGLGLLIYSLYILFIKHKRIEYIYYVILWIIYFTIANILPDIQKYYNLSIFRILVKPST